MHGLGSTT